MEVDGAYDSVLLFVWGWLSQFQKEIQENILNKKTSNRNQNFISTKKRKNICHNSKSTYKTSEENTGRHTKIKTMLDMLMLHWTLNWQMFDKTRRKGTAVLNETRYEQSGRGRTEEQRLIEIKHISGTEKLRCTNVYGHGRLTKAILTLQVLRISLKILPRSSFCVIVHIVI